MNIFVTGATGFLGYNIVLKCVADGHNVLCLCRTTSKSLFDIFTESKVHWINSDQKTWKETVRNFKPDVLIHAAWAGVSAGKRKDSTIQKHNLKFSQNIFSIYPYKQIICLGSQDEYGRIDSIIDENHPLTPISEYAKSKIEVCKYLERYCVQNQIEWQWIRVFSVYGEKQKSEWIIPSIINKCLCGTKSMDTTKGEQKYAYLYVRDFAKAITTVFGVKGKSGIYNLSSSHPCALKKIFEFIRMNTQSEIVFNYGSIPYRENQSMVIAGNSSKFISAFGQYEITPLEDGIKLTIEHYKR